MKNIWNRLKLVSNKGHAFYREGISLQLVQLHEESTQFVWGRDSIGAPSSIGGGIFQEGAPPTNFIQLEPTEQRRRMFSVGDDEDGPCATIVRIVKFEHEVEIVYSTGLVVGFPMSAVRRWRRFEPNAQAEAKEKRNRFHEEIAPLSEALRAFSQVTERFAQLLQKLT